MGSTRLPGKNLADVCGRPMLGMLLERLLRARSLDRTVLALPDGAANDPLESLGERLGVACVRGSETDVLGRFVLAMDAFPSAAVVRITADNPFTDAEQVDALVRFFTAHPLDYAQNLRPSSGYPDGVGAEIVASDALRQAARGTDDPADREHVTLYVAQHPELFRADVLRAPHAFRRPDLRLDVDYPADLVFAQRLCAALPTEGAPHWSTREIIQALDLHPELLTLRESRSEGPG